MNEPDRLTARGGKLHVYDTRNRILRIVVVALLTVLLWHMVIAGKP
jgi:hypothetical protein